MNKNSSEIKAIGEVSSIVKNNITDKSTNGDTEIKIDKVQSNFLFDKMNISPIRRQFVTLMNNDNVRLKNTRMCKFVIENGSCPRVTCNFAHTVSELEPVKCIFDGNCNYKENGCTYHHSGESLENYIIKIGYESLLQTPYELTCSKNDIEDFFKIFEKTVELGKKNIRVRIIE